MGWVRNRKEGSERYPELGRSWQCSISEAIKSKKDVGWALELERSRQWSSKV